MTTMPIVSEIGFLNVPHKESHQCTAKLIENLET